MYLNRTGKTPKDEVNWVIKLRQFRRAKNREKPFASINKIQYYFIDKCSLLSYMVITLNWNQLEDGEERITEKLFIMVEEGRQ